MWSEDEEPARKANALPDAVRRAHLASRRPKQAHWFTACSAVVGAVAAIFITIALTAGICFDVAQSCSPLGQSTAIFCLFTVPLGVAIGLVAGGRQVDKALRSYRPEM